MDSIVITRSVLGGGKMDAAAAQFIRSYINSALPETEAIISIAPCNSVAGVLDIMPLPELIQRVKQLQALASTQVDITNINAVLDLLNELSTWLPFAGKVQGHCKYYLLAAETTAIEQMPEGIRTLSTTERTKWAKGKSAEYAALYEVTERTCAAMTHRCDHLRTFVSYEKSQAQMNYVPNAK
jgi:hypothetical protein